MSRGARILSLGVLVAAVPLVLVGNALWLLATDAFVSLQYSLGVAGPDPLGLDEHQRRALARASVGAISPAGEGVGLMREARLPGGAPAFTEREIDHMADVRGLVRAFVTAWAIATVAGLGAATALSRAGLTKRAARAAATGAAITLAAMGLLGLVMLLAFDFFFVGFHELFFPAGTWTFAADSVLLALFPYSFWGVAGAAMAALVLGQAGLLVLAARRLGRGRRSAVTARAAPA